MTFEEAVAVILEKEGGTSDDIHDPGKLTKWGISSVSYPQVKDAAFSKQDAIELYRHDFWNRFQCDKMPDGIGLLFFDACVNQTFQAPRLLQRAVGVTADGVVGPATLAAVQAANRVELLQELAARRAVAYAQNPNVAVFGLGWFRRLMDILVRATSPRLIR